MKNFYIVEHPLLLHYLTILRNKNTRQEIVTDSDSRKCGPDQAPARSPYRYGGSYSPLSRPGLGETAAAHRLYGPRSLFRTKHVNEGYDPGHYSSFSAYTSAGLANSLPSVGTRLNANAPKTISISPRGQKRMR